MVVNSFTNNFHFYHKDENNNLLHKANIQLMLSPAANKTGLRYSQIKIMIPLNARPRGKQAEACT